MRVGGKAVHGLLGERGAEPVRRETWNEGRTAEHKRIKGVTNMERSLVKKIHKEIDEALKKVAEANGFIYKPGNVTYSSLDLRTKVQFILAAKTAEFEKTNTIQAYGGLVAGDSVTIAGRAISEEYKVVRFTNRGSAIIELNGKQYRAPVSALTKVDANAQPVVFNTRSPRTRSEEDILNDLRNVENALSPENLSCDGELPQAEVRRRYNSLMAEKSRLTKELGRVPTDKELYPEIYK